MSEFEKIVRVSGAYDKRHQDPHKNYGISACRIWFILKGPLGAVQFVVGTDWHLPHVQREFREKHYEFASKFDEIEPKGWDVGYHAKEPHFDGQDSMECDLVEGGRCYYDGSSLAADEWVPRFIAGGTDWLWPALEERYAEVFESEAREQ